MRAFSAVVMILGWFAIIAQLYLILQNSLTGFVSTIIRFLSFFTILTNILVAVCFTVLCLFPLSKWALFFKRAGVFTAITVYITIVGIVYNLLLRQVWDPQGLQKVVDELLHSVIPVLCIVYFIAFTAKEKLSWTKAFSWLLFPALYAVYIIIRGEIVGEYPYPFIDVGVLGYPAALVNCLFIVIGFLVVSFVFVALGRYARAPKREP